MTDVGNGILNPLPGEPPAEPPATPGTVTVWVKIPWTKRVDDKPVNMVALERTARDRFVKALYDGSVVKPGVLPHLISVAALLRLMGFSPQGIDIETESEFEFVADQDPGGEG